MVCFTQTLLQPSMLFLPGSSANCLQIQDYCSYSNIPRYNRIHWQQICPGKEAAGVCLSSPDSSASPLPWQECKIERSRRIFQIEMVSKKRTFVKICWLVSSGHELNDHCQPRTAKDILPDLQSWACLLKFWIELLFIPIMNITIKGNP